MVVETETHTESRGEPNGINASLRYGSTLMALGFAGLGVFGAALTVRVLAGEGVIESGVNIGATTAELAAFNPALPDYIAHIRMTAAGMFVGVAILGIAVTWYGVRRGQRWAWTAAVVALVIGTVIGVPMHYSSPFHVDQMRHLGPAYAALAVFVVGAIFAFRGLGRSAEP